MTKSTRIGIVLALTLIVSQTSAQSYDIAINNGRVIDPETGLDGIRHVGVSGDEIAAISDTPLDAAYVLDATGLIVSPGFIDIHSHSYELPAQRMAAFDGVTTAIEMESGILPVAEWYELQAQEGRAINYGASAAWTYARIMAMIPDMPDPKPTLEWYQSAFRFDRWVNEVSTSEELAIMLDSLQRGLDEGAIGIGVNSGYVPAAGGKELTAVFGLAAQNNVPISTHIREWSMVDPLSSVEGISTVIGLAATTGARVNVCHINSTSLGDGSETVALLTRAREDGIDIHAEAYPYGLGTFPISSAIYQFERDKFLARIGVDFNAIRVLNEGRNIKDEDDLRAEQAADPGQGTILTYLDEDNPKDRQVLSASVTSRWIGIASDAVPYVDSQGNYLRGDVWPVPESYSSNPRTAGTFSRFLGRWVREQGALDWPLAIAKVSYIPARLFDGMVPAMERKGRLQVGLDADITVFDPETIIDRATPDASHLASEGVIYLIVNGTLLIDDGKIDLKVRPGRPIRRATAN